MTTTLEAPSALKSHEALDKVFNVLFTPTMFTEIENHSTHLSISKGALIRLAIEEYLRNLEPNKPVEHQA